MDIEMPDMYGYEAIQKLKGDQRYSDIPIAL
jgi:CheY-like chemotaxis protein